MNKMDVFKVINEIQTSLPLGGSMNTNIKELISLVEQEYIIGEYVKVEDLRQPMYSVDNIYITNSAWFYSLCNRVNEQQYRFFYVVL